MQSQFHTIPEPHPDLNFIVPLNIIHRIYSTLKGSNTTFEHILQLVFREILNIYPLIAIICLRFAAYRLRIKLKTHLIFHENLFNITCTENTEHTQLTILKSQNSNLHKLFTRHSQIKIHYNGHQVRSFKFHE